MEEKEVAMSSEFHKGAYILSVDLASCVYMDPETYKQEMTRIQALLDQPVFSNALLDIFSDARFTHELTKNGEVVTLESLAQLV